MNPSPGIMKSVSGLDKSATQSQGAPRSFEMTANQRFTEALLDPKIADPLQRLSDEEQVSVLRAIAKYDANAFLARLAKIGDALPK